MRQAAKRRERNRQQRRRLRSAIKNVRTASSAEAAQEAFRNAERLLDRAAQKGLISKNAAARSKHRLSKVMAAAS
jgi:small subunit ribosomal protein S20